MATSLRIVDVNGKAKMIFKGKDQTWAEVVERAHLDRRYETCERNWLSDDEENTQMEERVKAYLDRIGDALIRDGSGEGVISEYGAVKDRMATVPASICAGFDNYLYSAAEEPGEDFGYVGDNRYDEREMTETEKAILKSLTKSGRMNKEIRRIHEQNKKINAMFEKYPG